MQLVHKWKFMDNKILCVGGEGREVEKIGKSHLNDMNGRMDNVALK